MQLRHLVCLTALSLPLASYGDVVFSDTFNGASTVQSATPGTPTSSSADYEVFTQNAAPAGMTIAPGDLHFGTVNTTAAIGQVQAQFAATPITLLNIGDYAEIILTFTDTANVLISGQNANASMIIGLYNSGGVAPNPGARLDSGNVTGGAQNWKGYAGRLFLNGNASSYNRNAQTANGTTSQNQDLLFNNASSSAAFNSPTGGALTGNTGGSNPSFTGLTQGNVYTVDFKLTLTGATTISEANTLYNGATPVGTPIISQSATAGTALEIATTIDALAFGYRQNNATGEAASVDISSIIVDAPEPTTLALSGLAILSFAVARRLKRQI